MADRSPRNPNLIPGPNPRGHNVPGNPSEGESYGASYLARALSAGGHGNATVSHAVQAIAGNAPGSEAGLWESVFLNVKGRI